MMWEALEFTLDLALLFCLFTVFTVMAAQLFESCDPA